MQLLHRSIAQCRPLQLPSPASLPCPAGSLAAALGEAAISSQPYWLDSFVMRALVLPVLKLLMPVLPGLVCAILAFLVLTALAMVALALALLPSSAGWLALGAARPLGEHKSVVQGTWGPAVWLTALGAMTLIGMPTS